VGIYYCTHLYINRNKTIILMRFYL
jgi:hypothetical protein